MFDTDFTVAYVRVVEGCNLNCTHCFTLGNQEKIKYTPIETIKYFLSAIDMNIHPKALTVYLHGGETFLRPLEDLVQIADYIRDKFHYTKLVIVPQTNLIYKLTDEHIDFIKNQCGNQVGISWDYEIRFGSIRTEKAEEKEKLFFSNMRKLIDAGIDVHVAITQQKHLLNADPIKVIEMFDGVKSIDFELLTIFDEKTKDLKVNNQKWSDWYMHIVRYYHDHDVSWSLPQMDLLFKNMKEGAQQDCKCNCCNKRTFTLNTNGSVGLCPDFAYVSPISTAREMYQDWTTFTAKSQDTLIQDLIDKSSSICYECEHFDICGGNCNNQLFDDTDECPLSRASISYARKHQLTFFDRLEKKAMNNLPELKGR